MISRKKALGDMHRLRNLIKKTTISLPAALDRTIRGVSYDSRKISRGDLFFAVRGHNVDGNTFLTEVCEKGAAAAVTGVKHYGSADRLHPVLFSRNLQQDMSRIADNFYGHPSKDMQVVGVTGTNGKTTITYFLEHICRCARIPSGVFGTINYRYGKNIFPAGTTTPQSIDLQRILRLMHAHKVQKVFMEVSSHSLALKRVEDVAFRCGVFTNLTRDHLDFHKTMEGYFRAKQILFRKMNRAAVAGRIAVINTDDPFGKRLVKICRFPVITYGMHHDQDITARKVILSPSGSSYELKIVNRIYPVQMHLTGEYNVYNALAAAGAAMSLGIPNETIIKGLCDLTGVPGRMEKVLIKVPFTVIVDYAHTNDALFNVLAALEKTKPERILTVFGCGGDRDRKKRPIMGRIAVEKSHHAWITLDNPRTEDPERIMNDILEGVRNTGLKNYSVIYERKKAIAAALRSARAGDVVLIAGKGHEKYQILKNKTIPFDDKQVVLELLRS